MKIGEDHSSVVHVEDVSGAAVCNGDMTYPVKPGTPLSCLECLRFDQTWRKRHVVTAKR